MYESLECMLKDFTNYFWCLKITSAIGVSPLVFLQFVQNIENSSDLGNTNTKISWTREKQTYVLDEIAKECLKNNILIISTGGHVIHHLLAVPPPSLRLSIMSKHSRDDIDNSIKVLHDSIFLVMREYT